MQTKMGINSRSGAWMVKIASIFLFIFALFPGPSLAQVGDFASPAISASILKEGCKIAFHKDVKHSDSDPLSSGNFDIRAMWTCTGSTDIEIDRYEIEGGSPEIVTVLFWKRQKAVILVRWSTNSQASDFQGDYYKVYVYDYSKNMSPKTFISRSDIDKKFGEGWDGVLNDKKIVYKYKDAQSIKYRLKKMGY